MRTSSQIQAMMWLFLQTTLRSRRILLVGLAGLLPLLLFVIAALSSTGDASHRLGLFSTFQYLGPIGMMLPFAGLFLGLSVVSEELDNGTLVYLLVRPFSRARLLAGRALAAGLVLVVALTLLNLLLVAVTRPAGIVTTFLGAELVLVLGAITYISIFTFIAVLFRKPVTQGLFFLIAWDLGVSSLDFSLRYASVRFNLMNLYKKLVDVPRHYDSLIGNLWELCDLSMAASLTILACFVVFSWGFAVYRFRRFQL